MSAHAWVAALTAAVIALLVLTVLLNMQRSVWKRAFLWRAHDDHVIAQRTPSGPSDYELARREITRHV